MPAQMNFGIGQVVDPTAGLQRTLSDMGTKLEASKLEDIRKQALAQQQAEAQAQQDYRIKSLMQSGEQAKASLEEQRRSTNIRATHDEKTLAQQAVEADAIAEHRKAQRELDKKKYEAERSDRQYEVSREEGEILGKSTPLTEVEVRTETLKDVDAAKYGDLMKKSLGNIGVSEEDKQKAWEEYAIKNIPGYDVKKGMAQKALETVTPIAMAGPRLMGTAIIKGQEALTPKSQQDIEREGLKTTVKPPITREQFITDYEAKEVAKLQRDTKKALQDYVKTDVGGKDLGIVTEKQVQTLKRVPMDVLQSQINDVVGDYAKKNPKASHGTLMGIRKGLTDKLDTIQSIRSKADIETIKKFNDEARDATKQQYAKDLIDYRNKYGIEPTIQDQLDMQLQALRIQKLQKELEKDD